MSHSYHVRFMYEGSYYFFWTSQYASVNNFNPVDVSFNPDDPGDAYVNSFGGFWRWGLGWIRILFVPWSAAALSIGSGERLVISRKKIGMKKRLELFLREKKYW